MTEKIHIAKEKDKKDKQPNYTARHFGAAMALTGAVVGGAIGMNKLTASDKAPEIERYVTGQRSAEVQEGQNANNIAINLGNGIIATLNNDPNASLSTEQQESVTTQMKGNRDFSVIHEGDMVTVTVGELDGKLDENGEAGTDIVVDIDKSDGG